MRDTTPATSLDDLRIAIEAHAPEALLVEPWLMRRIIRLDRRFTGLSVRVPHRKTYVIKGASLLAFVDRTDLNVEPTRELADWVVLLSQPTEDVVQRLAGDALLLRYWRLLFHARVHLKLDCDFQQLDRVTLAEERWQQIGKCEQNEIRNVLIQEELLFHEADDWETYVEFAAVYLERRCFDPETVPAFFPAIRDWSAIERIVSRDVPYQTLLQETRLSEIAGPAFEATTLPPERELAQEAPLTPREPKSRRLRTRAERAAHVGNCVRAAITFIQASRCADDDQSQSLLDGSRHELELLIERLCTHLHLPPHQKAQWLAALLPMVDRAATNIWSAEGRLLFDLQKACLEYESEVSLVDVIPWVSSLGRVPLRRPAPLLRDVLVVKHLRTASRRLAKSQRSEADRADLVQLLAGAVEHVEAQLRARIKPLIVDVLNEVGLTPHNIPEQVSRNKIVEELLDQLVDHGFLNIGALRDSLSKGDLKIPDVSGLRELTWGDRLLRADRRLSQVLPGVYRPAMIYLRWSQSLSSLAFGTRVGRWATMYLAIPFGGAFLALEGLRHAAEWISPRHVEPATSVAASAPTTLAAAGPPAVHGFDWSFLTAEIGLGVFILLLIHVAPFRSVCHTALQHLGHVARRLFVDLPLRLLRFRWIEQLLHSPAYAAVRSYFFKPAVFTALVQVVAGPFLGAFGPHWLAHLYLGSALFLNSPLGRYTDEWLTDVFVRTVEEFRVRVLAAMFGWIMGVFQRLLSGLTRVLHTLDEWTRFRTRDNRPMKAVKFIGGALWSVVSYVIVFVSTLLIEPQINPIKHFPVVTVSHKLILPFGPTLVSRLSPYLGAAKANTIVWSTIWLIPGVFGFLVWELRENWRLYAANRPARLRPAVIGHHGETMPGLLRPSFHSGLLPKLYARLRRAMQQVKRVGHWKSVNRQRAELQEVDLAIRHFIQRELFSLLDQAGVCPDGSLRVADLRLATNRIEAVLSHVEAENARLQITWEESRGVLTASIAQDQLLQTLDAEKRRDVAYALAGLLQRSGADRARPVGPAPAKSIAWKDWVKHWSPDLSDAPPLASRHRFPEEAR